jgi:hypothetical protein
MALVNKGWAFVSSSTAGGTPGGGNTQVQYNDGGSFQGDANLTWDGSQLSTTNVSASTNISASAFYGDGSNLTGITASAVEVADGPEQALQFRVDTPVSGEISGSAALMFLTGSETLQLSGTLQMTGSGVINWSNPGWDRYISGEENGNSLIMHADGDITFEVGGDRISWKDEGGNTLGEMALKETGSMWIFKDSTQTEVFRLDGTTHGLSVATALTASTIVGGSPITITASQVSVTASAGPVDLQSNNFASGTVRVSDTILPSWGSIAFGDHDGASIRTIIGRVFFGGEDRLFVNNSVGRIQLSGSGPLGVYLDSHATTNHEISSSTVISASAFYANGVELTPGGGSGSATVGTTTDNGNTTRYLPFVANATGVASASILISDAVSLKPGSGSLTLDGEGAQGVLEPGFFVITSSYGSSISLKGADVGTNPDTEAFINVVSSSFFIPSGAFGPGEPPFDFTSEFETLEIVAPSGKTKGGNISLSGSGDLYIDFTNTETRTFGSTLSFGGVEIALYATESAMGDVFSITNGTIPDAPTYALLDFDKGGWYFSHGDTSGSIQTFTTDLTGTFNAGLVVNNDSGTMNQGLQINGSASHNLTVNVTSSFNNDADFWGAHTRINSNTVRIDGVAGNENQPPANRNLYVSSSNGNGVVTERWTNIAATTAGNGLTASSGVMTIETTGSSLGLDFDGLRVNLGNLSGLAISGSVPGPGGLIISGSNLLEGFLGTGTWYDNTIMYVDLDDSAALPYHPMKKTSFATMVGKMAGTGLTASSGQLSLDGGPAYRTFESVTGSAFTASAPYPGIYRMRTGAGAPGNMEVLLPSISGVPAIDGLTLSFKDTDGSGSAHNIVLRASPGDDINGGSSVTVLNDWGSNTIVADATAARWYVMAKS